MKCYIVRNTTETKFPHEGCTLQSAIQNPEKVAEFESLAEARKALNDYKCTCKSFRTPSGIMYAVTEYYIEDIHGEVWTIADREGE